MLLGSIVVFSFVFKSQTVQKLEVSDSQASVPVLKDDHIEKKLTEEEIFRTPNSGQYGDMHFWTKRLFSADGVHNYNIEFPQFIGGKEVVNVNAYLERSLSEALEWRKSNLWAEGEDRSKSKKFNLDIRYRIASIADDIISIDFVLDDHLDGGDGNNHQSIVINWDLKGDRLLATDDIFCTSDYRGKIVKIIQEGAYEFAFSDLSAETNEKIDGIVRNRIHAHEARLTDVLIGYKGITFLMPPYTIVDGYEGIIRLPIPYSSLKGIVCLP